jgi:hypothetical protein
MAAELRREELSFMAMAFREFWWGFPEGSG